MSDIRIGHGYDVHRLSYGRTLILGGVEIPYEKGLDGHSDADVLMHAIMDSVLGALALGDIGRHFPDSDNRYKGISSIKLCEKVCKLMNECGYSIGNIDATVIAQSPKLSPYIDSMRGNIAKVFETSESRVNCKATTEEHLGFTGDGSGIAAHAVCILNKKEL